ncbi:MAG: LptA/OstA family protein [Kiloniellales bacterium]|nr:LptA/OstA family protein [Kiloniellales bacterium]
MKQRQPALGRLAALALAMALLPTGLAAQGLLGGGKGKSPLEINADQGIEWRRDQRTYVASGNARATRGDLELFADVLTAHYRDAPDGSSEIYKITANGNVRIVSPNEEARGDRGAYDVDNGVVVLLGENLRLTTPEEVITARDSLEYWEQKQMAVARGEALAKREDRQISADVLAAHYQPGADEKLELQRIEAYGNVEVETDREYARGDRGTYFVDKELATLQGTVKITRGQNQMNGDYAEVDLTTGVSRLLSSGSGVKGMILPKAVTGDNESAPKVQ